MNEIAMIDKNLSIDRTPQLIAIEINSIKEQTRKIMLFNSIEIGKRLAEAKIMLGHGEWGQWLKESVDYSQRTASNLMGIFEQYGTSQLNMFCDNNAKSQALANLSYTQAVLMMGIPQDEREAFIEEHDIDSLSTRELQQAIKEKHELEEKLKKAEEIAKTHKEQSEATDQSLNDLTDSYTELQEALIKANQKAESDKKVAESILRTTEDVVKKLQSDLQKEKDESNKEIIRLGQSIVDMNKSLEEAKASENSDEVERLQESLEKTDTELAVSLSKIADLESQLKETPIDVTAAPVVEKVPEAVERELQELREKNKELEAKGAQPISTAPIRFKLQFDSLVKGFGELLGTLNELDADARDKYKNAVKGLIGKMSEKL